MRLDKAINDYLGCGRSEIKNNIKKGLVLVNHQTVLTPDFSVDPESDLISYNGQEIRQQTQYYYMFHKPAGCVSATKDNISKTVIDYFDLPKGIKEQLFPVGRLDKDTEGLLFISTDGEWCHRLMSPKYHVDKTYFVRLQAPLSDDDITQLQQGVDIGEKHITKPAVLSNYQEDQLTVCITIQEGMYHQVKRMFQAVHNQVLYLKRLKIGNIGLDESLNPGEYRELTAEELKSLQ